MKKIDKKLAEIYSDLDELDNDFRNANLINKLIKLAHGRSALEIGCGNGALLSKLKKLGMLVVGIEPNIDILSVARKNNPDLNIKQGFAEDIDDILNDKFDNILMIDVIEHIEYDNNLVSKLCKFLNDEGELIIFVPAYNYLYGKRDMEIGHYRRYNKKSLELLLESNGFRATKISYWNMLGVAPYFISEKLFKKPLITSLRNKKQNNLFKKIISKLLFYWFKYIENNINLGFGLSLVCVAKKK